MNFVDFLPTSTAHMYRFPVFQATRKPVYIDVSPRIETPWGWLILERSRMGQPHADVLESTMYNKEQHQFLRDKKGDRLQILIDPARLRRSIKKATHESLWSCLKDMKSALIDMYVNAHKKGYLCSIIDEVERSDHSRAENDPRTAAMRTANDDGLGRRFWIVTFSRQWTSFLRGDIATFGDPSDVIALKSGITQAIVRHVMTHKDEPNGGWIVDNLIAAVSGVDAAGNTAGNINIRKQRHKLICDRVGLLKCGFVVDGRRLKKAD